MVGVLCAITDSALTQITDARRQNIKSFCRDMNQCPIELSYRRAAINEPYAKKRCPGGIVRAHDDPWKPALTRTKEAHLMIKCSFLTETCYTRLEKDSYLR